MPNDLWPSGNRNIWIFSLKHMERRVGRHSSKHFAADRTIHNSQSKEHPHKDSRDESLFEIYLWDWKVVNLSIKPHRKGVFANANEFACRDTYLHLRGVNHVIDGLVTHDSNPPKEE
ncbi:hypothetical protein CDAR_25881 [Caerostris darwini]|uniref:Uncharacterized protein n=1 Tax=Caerostris darwini TaxID=1538125 RepID=A0AAV4PMA7_9ARAC|nr:hypothetical protein CDAR_25881 [Caerostris darwini]